VRGGCGRTMTAAPSPPVRTTPGRGGRSNNPIVPSASPSSPAVAPSSGIPYGYVPAFLPGSASLVEELDQRLLIVLRDGRHLVGTLRSFDQFSNMVMEDTSERKIHCHNGVSYFADVPLGLYIVRGDSVVLLGQLSDYAQERMKEVSMEELRTMIQESGTDNLEWDFDNDLTA